MTNDQSSLFPQASIEYARKLDAEDPLKNFREQFHFPRVNGNPAVYLCGNSLGLEPKSTRAAVEQELNDWASLAVDGHVEAKNPWVSYHKLLTRSTAKIVGAKPIEVASMNSLTVNLNLLFISFFRPTKKRFRIITESQNFSSDIYALEAQCKFHGLDPKKAIVEVQPRKGEHSLRTEDILKTIHKYRKEVAMVFFSGVNYFTGQAFEIKKITEAAHQAGSIAGFDLAHAAGNIALRLHDWEVDFASWCTYKYLNAGPGAVAQIFVHENHSHNFKLPRLVGWWGHDEKERFLMKKGFKAMPGAEGWAQSNVNILSMASLKASLEIFEAAGIKNIVKKSQQLTQYLEYLIRNSCSKKPQGASVFKIKIITPANKHERGCQLSIKVKKDAKKLFEILKKEKFIVDIRQPDVIRVSPVPLYNTFEEVYRFVDFLKDWCHHE